MCLLNSSIYVPQHSKVSMLGWFLTLIAASRRSACAATAVTLLLIDSVAIPMRDAAWPSLLAKSWMLCASTGQALTKPTHNRASYPPCIQTSPQRCSVWMRCATVSTSPMAALQRCLQCTLPQRSSNACTLLTQALVRRGVRLRTHKTTQGHVLTNPGLSLEVVMSLTRSPQIATAREDGFRTTKKRTPIAFRQERGLKQRQPTSQPALPKLQGRSPQSLSLSHRHSRARSQREDVVPDRIALLHCARNTPKCVRSMRENQSQSCNGSFFWPHLSCFETFARSFPGKSARKKPETESKT